MPVESLYTWALATLFIILTIIERFIFTSTVSRGAPIGILGLKFKAMNQTADHTNVDDECLGWVLDIPRCLTDRSVQH
jgi:hypothetical protein